MNAEKSKKQAKEAEPTEYPFVFALVTFPTASSKSVTCLTSSGYSLISAIPFKMISEKKKMGGKNIIYIKK